MRSFFFLIVGACLTLACDGGVSVEPTGSGGSSSTSTSSSSGAGGGSSSSVGGGGGNATGGGGSGGSACSAHGDCVVDSDCPGAAACVPLTPCGFKVCEQPIAAATSCHEPSFDACCDTSACNTGAGEACFEWPFGPFCGGVQPLPHNECVADSCQSDSDCPQPGGGYQAFCAPAQTLGFPTRTCFQATCLTDADCSAEAGGVCATVTSACCSSANVLACVYPSDGCRNDGDCNGNAHCDVENGAARCLPGPPICPA
ncbi:MAG TPA: hypothetical protein ENK23_04915 [Sorangium sp.]|nr:hypothetical protein [Sorangium sp.]